MEEVRRLVQAARRLAGLIDDAGLREEADRAWASVQARDDLRLDLVQAALRRRVAAAKRELQAAA